VSNIVWRLNVNCIVLGIVGVLNMLNNDGCPELRQLCNLAASHNAAVLEDVPEVVHMLAGGSCGGGGNHMACLKLFAGLMQPMPQL
jgi:hypothetical protein